MQAGHFEIIPRAYFQSDADVIRLYHEYCSENELKAASRNVFMDEFKSNNFSTFKPRKDQCDDCTQHAEGNLSEEHLYVIHIHDKDGKVIEQKILTKGHTQMKVDSVHSRIKTAIGQRPIYCPADYVRLMEEARKNPKS